VTEIERLTALRDSLLPNQGEQPRAGFSEAQRALNDAMTRDIAVRWCKPNPYGVSDPDDIGGLALLGKSC
jgi:hypothetical protein